MHVLWLPIYTVCLLFSLKNYTYIGDIWAIIFSSILTMELQYFSETARATCLKTSTYESSLSSTLGYQPIYSHPFPWTKLTVVSINTCNFALLPSTQIIRIHQSIHPSMTLLPLQGPDLPHKAPPILCPQLVCASIRKFNVPRIDPEPFL
jgi:hypothetical protein